jgi:hypothetical protein
VLRWGKHSVLTGNRIANWDRPVGKDYVSYLNLTNKHTHLANSRDDQTRGSPAMLRLSDIQNDAAVYFALSQPAEDIVNRIERKLLDRGLHFAFGGKGQCFLEIFSRADD